MKILTLVEIQISGQLGKEANRRFGLGNQKWWNPDQQAKWILRRKISFQDPKPFTHLNVRLALDNTSVLQWSHGHDHFYKLPWPSVQPSIFMWFRLLCGPCYKNSRWPRGLPWSYTSSSGFELPMRSSCGGPVQRRFPRAFQNISATVTTKDKGERLEAGKNTFIFQISVQKCKSVACPSLTWQGDYVTANECHF